jgi:hypothetical protein
MSKVKNKIKITIKKNYTKSYVDLKYVDPSRERVFAVEIP